MEIDWGYFDIFMDIIDYYMPAMGEGYTMASQICTAINKLIYKWFNDGDVFDNTHYLTGWCNDLSSYANWLYTYVDISRPILDKIEYCYNDEDYAILLANLADSILTFNFLKDFENKDRIGSIYKCNNKFKFVENWNDDEEDEY